MFAAFERDAVCCGVVTVPQCVVIQELLDGPREVGELATSSRVSRSGMTRLVDGLVRKGWVDRERSTEDRRRVIVSLTEEGVTLGRQLQEVTAQLIGSVLERVPAARRDEVTDAVQLLRQALAEAESEVVELCR
jgi:DNA-binding MarR family transcriptional regulator